MTVSLLRRKWIVPCVLLIAAAGCFQPAGSSLEATSVAQSARTLPVDMVETPTDEILLTEIPSETPTETPFEALPTETPTEFFMETPIQVAQLPTETPTVDVLAQLSALSTQLAENNIDPAFATATVEALFLEQQRQAEALSVFPTPTVPEVASVPTQIAQLPEGDIDPLFLTATALLQAAQGIPQDPTADPNLDFFQPTADLGLDFVQPEVPFDPNAEQFDPNAGQIDPLFQTATETILEATRTVEYATQTTFAILQAGPTLAPTTFFPTLTPAFENSGAGDGAGFGTAQPVLTGNDCAYTVVTGNNLFRISLQYNTTVSALAQRNNIVNANLIFPGQQIVIPNCGGQPNPTPAVFPTYNPTYPYPNPGQCGQNTSPGDGEQSYTVQQFDTLFKLSLQYGVRVVNIAQRNCVPNINLIYIQQPLIIPPREF